MALHNLQCGATSVCFVVTGRLEETVLNHLERLKSDGVFDADQVRVLTVAFESAWQAVQASGARFASNGHVAATRELLALRIIEVAQSSGLSDHAHLRDDALLYLTQSNRRSSGC